MHNVSLVFFTILIQTAVGIFWAALFNIWTDNNGVGQIPLSILSVCLGLIILGLISAMAHLGKPENAPHAIVNITRSWLSREIVSIHLFAMGIVVLWILTVLEVQTGLFIVEIVVLALGIVTVLTMGKVYGLRTVPVWNNTATFLDFWGTAVLTGGVASAGLNVLISDKGHAPDPGVLMFLCLGLGLKLFSLFSRSAVQKRSAGLFWYASVRTKTRGKISTYVVHACLYTIAVALSAAVSMDMTGQPVFFLLVSCGVILVTEIWNRFLFYDSFGRLGL